MLRLTILRIRHRRWYVEEGAPGPISGAVAAVADTGANCVGDIKHFKRRVRRSKTRKEAGEKANADPTVDEDHPNTGTALAELCMQLAAEGATGKPNNPISMIDPLILTPTHSTHKLLVPGRQWVP